jgi:steroid delta-isomerase-like uncharacterized protein
MTPEQLLTFARDYTAAWCSQDPDQVAAFFAEDGSLTINDGEPAVGRAAIADSARGFMTAFPDLKVMLDQVELRAPNEVVYRWTLEGHHTGPGGSGRFVRISGFEEWTLNDGLVHRSLGHFDSADYDRQVSGS